MEARWVSLVLVLGFVAAAAGCATDAQTGALIGTGVGAGAGQAIGGNTKGTLIGAGVGALGGYLIGNESDKARAARQQPQPVVVQQAPPTIVVQQAPPPVIVEQPVAYPGPGYVWVNGYWFWDGGRYAWQSGYWVMPPQPTVVWDPPHYERFDRGYHYRPGYWHHR